MAADIPHPAFEPSRFAGDDAFVRALLRRCVSDPHLADDLAQETWLAALRQAAGGGLFTRAWLGTVARNFVLQTLRGDRRRALREQAVARELAVDAGDGAGAADQRARVLAVVAALDEPYAQVLRLRFLSDLMPTAIAEQLQLPVETVRTRLKRALQQVRAALQQGPARGNEPPGA